MEGIFYTILLFFMGVFVDQLIYYLCKFYIST